MTGRYRFEVVARPGGLASLRIVDQERRQEIARMLLDRHEVGQLRDALANAPAPATAACAESVPGALQKRVACAHRIFEAFDQPAKTGVRIRLFVAAQGAPLGLTDTDWCEAVEAEKRGAPLP